MDWSRVGVRSGRGGRADWSLVPRCPSMAEKHYVEHLVCTGCDRVIWIAIRGCPSGGRVLPRSIRAGPSGDRGVPGRHFLEHLVCMRSDLERVLERIRVSFAGRGLGSLVDWASEKLGCCWVSLIYFLFIFLFNQIN